MTTRDKMITHIARRLMQENRTPTALEMNEIVEGYCYGYPAAQRYYTAMSDRAYKRLANAIMRRKSQMEKELAWRSN